MGNSRTFRRIGVATLALTALVLFPSPEASPMKKDYSRLVGLLNLQDKEEAPLYAFNRFEDDFDPTVQRMDLGYFNDHPTLLQNIRKDLGNGRISWRLEHARHRLLFVPEKREPFSRLFESYCRDVIDYVLKQTELANPYTRIETLRQENPQLSGQGVSVFLVHNLAEELVGTYVFSNPVQESLIVEITRKTFLGEVGSYSTNIRFSPAGEPEFLWNRFTIWQTTAKNPFAVLCVPAEETLHIALREHTHRAILQQFRPKPQEESQDLESIVNDWMAVEEAVVGAVTYALLPGFLKKYEIDLSDSIMEQECESRSRFKQYLHLGKAMELVGNLGPKKAIQLYVDDPENFRQSLI